MTKRRSCALEVLWIAWQQGEAKAFALATAQRVRLANPAHGEAVLALVGIFEADFLALDRPLALGKVAPLHQGERAVLAVELEENITVDLAGERVADDRQPGFPARQGLGIACRRRGRRRCLGRRGGAGGGTTRCPGARAGVVDSQPENVRKRAGFP